MEATVIDTAIANFPNFAGFVLALALLYRAHMKALDTIQQQQSAILECYKSMRNLPE